MCTNKKYIVAFCLHFFCQLQLSTLHDHVMSLELASDWVARVNDCPREFLMFKIYRHDGSDGSSEGEPIVVVRTLTVSEDMTWSVTVNGHKLDPSISLATSKFPATLKYDDFKALVTVVTKYRVCCGHPDDAFVEMGHKKKGEVYVYWK